MSVQWPSIFFVVVREELCLISRDIDVRRAFGFACFTRQTQVERFLDVLIVPAVAQHFALQQLKQHVRAPSRAVFLLSRGHVARAHGAAIIFPACSEPDAAQRCFSQRAVVLRKLKMSLRPLRTVIRAEAQIFCWKIWIDYFVRVELVFGISHALEFSERLHQLRTKHFWKERSARLPVAVL